MPHDLFLQVALSREPAQPNGKPCPCCGDAVYLKAWRIVVEAPPGHRAGCASELLCDACADALEIPVLTPRPSPLTPRRGSAHA